MSHIWGINWQRYHADQLDLPHIERMQYKAVLLFEWMWSDRDFCANLLAVLPQDCIIICRDHPLSEQKADMYADPAGTGQRHAMEWIRKFNSGRVYIPRERCWVQGINEPDSNHAQKAIDDYTANLAHDLYNFGLIRCAGWVFGTGHPSTVDLQPTAPVDWHWYAASAQALKEYGGLASFHAYGSWNNMALDNHLCRAETCPYALPAVFDEFGIDEGIVGDHGKGWQAHLSADQYIAWLDAAQLRVRERMARSPLDLKALCLFTYDYNSDWKSFDVQGIRPQLEAAGWTTPATVPPTTIHLPAIGATPQEPTAEPTEPQPPAPTPTDEFARCYAFTRRWEGGWANHPADKGGPTMRGITIGTYTHWRREQGMPDPSPEDLRAISDADVLAIYREWYWEPAGAQVLPYPLNLTVFDSAVLHGVTTAVWMLQEVKGSALGVLGLRLLTYEGIIERDPGQAVFHDAWRRRVRELRTLVRAALGLD